MAQRWEDLDDGFNELLIDTRRSCRGCGRIDNLEDGYCHKCNARPVESDDAIWERKRRVRPEWFDAEGNYKPVGRL